MTDDGLDIPEFLRRKPGEKPAKLPDPLPPPPADVSQDRWRKIEEQRKERKKLKSRGRIAKMKAVMADREAVKAGKTWNATKGIWE